MIYKLIASALVDALFKRPGKRNIKKIEKRSIENLEKSGRHDLAEIFLRAEDTLASYKPEEMFIDSYDGTPLYARYFKAPVESDLTFVLLHGYKGSCSRNFILQFETLRDLGANVLMPDQRAHGRSGGDYITFGVKERYDTEAWVSRLLSLNPNAKVILYGISMGASTAIAAASLSSLRQCLKGVIADCGFTSPADEFNHLAVFHGRKAPEKFLTISAEVVQKKADFSTTAYNTIDSASTMTVPALFVHGEQDTFVPASFTVSNYEACASSYKRLLLVKGAGHAVSFCHGKDRYTEEIKALLKATEGT